MNTKKKNNKSLNNQKKIILTVLLFVIILVVLLVGILKLTEKKQPTGLVVDDFYGDTCTCLERGLNKCLSGYELSVKWDGELCINKTLGTFTNIVKGCSKYDCSGIIYEYNFDIKFWEIK